MLGRALIGLGVAVALMAGLKAIVLWFPPERIALANGWYIMLGALGAVSATAPAEIVSSRHRLARPVRRPRRGDGGRGAADPSRRAGAPAGHARAALAVVADAPNVAPRRVRQEDVGPQVDGLRRALKAPSEAGKRTKVDGGVDGDEHIGILRHGLVGRERAEQGDPQNAGRRPRRPNEREHGLEQMRSRVRHRGPGSKRPAVAAACHEAVGLLRA